LLYIDYVLITKLNRRSQEELLAQETNRRMLELLHGEDYWLKGEIKESEAKVIPGGISTEEEEKELEALMQWMEQQSLPTGIMSYDFSDEETGEQLAVFDLAWPNGIQEELSEPAAVLLNEPAETISIANRAGFRCFTSVKEFKTYVKSEILKEQLEVPL